MSHDGPAREELRQRSARGGALLFAANAAQLLVAIVATMILARVLTPADFGLFAMATTVIALAGPVRDFGLPFAIAHAPVLDDARLDALFRRNALLAAALGAALCAAAPLAALWFGEPAVAAMVVALAFGTALRALANVQFGLLTRGMRHGALALAGPGSEIAGAVVAVALAVAGAGVAALVAQQLLALSAQALVAWRAAGWRPRFGYRGASVSVAVPADESVRALVVYAREHTLARTISAGGEMTDRLLVGRVAGAAALGLYQSALRWVTLPLVQMLQPFKSVAVAGFSRLHAEAPEDYRRYAAHVFAAVQSLVLPAFALLALEAPRLVGVLLGEQWTAAVPLFRLLAVAMVFHSVELASVWIYLGEGRTRARLRWSLATAPLTVLAMLVGVRWGATGVAWAFLLSRAALAGPAMLVCLRGSPLRHRDLWRGAWRPALATLAAGLATFSVGRLGADAAWPAALGLATSGAVFATVYALVWLLLPDGRRTAGLWLGSLRTAAPAGTASR